MQSRNPALTARSVLASVLLGMRRPELSGQRLVRTAELFGFSEGTTRVALSRMVSAGELEAGAGRYRLAGPLRSRQVRQDLSRRPPEGRWSGEWRLAIVPAGARPAGARLELRRTLGRLRLAEWREGVWARPDNVAVAAAPPCTWLVARLDHEEDNVTVARRLWDLHAWSARAVALRAEMRATLPEIMAGRTEALAPCFVIAAAVVRHLVADPLLPVELLPARWPGPALRREYDRYESGYQDLLRSWLSGLER